MKGVVEYLDDLKEKTGSDYASAKALKINKVSVSLIRKRGQMADETAVKMAKLLGIDEGEVLLSAAAARSEGDVKKEWEKIWTKIAKQSARAAILVLMVGMHYPDVFRGIEGVKMTQINESFVNNIHYAKPYLFLPTARLLVLRNHFI